MKKLKEKKEKKDKGTGDYSPMANVIDQNPLILDTAADDIFPVTTTLTITKIRWVGVPAGGATMQLEDGREKIIWKSTITEVTAVGEVVDVESNFNPPLVVGGLSLGTDGGGELFVYYDGSTPLKTT